MIYGNHDMKKSDIVKVATWEPELIKELATAFRANEAVIEDARFVVENIDYKNRLILIMAHTSKLITAMYAISLDATSLIRVGRLYEK